MKKFNTILPHLKLIIVAVLCFNCSGKKESNKINDHEFLISGTLDSDRYTIAYLSKRENYRWNGKLIRIDSAIINDRKFEFKGSIEFPVQYRIDFKDHKKGFDFFVENGTINIEITESDQFSYKISGSKLQLILDEHDQLVNQIFSDLPAVLTRRAEAVKKGNQEEINRLDSIRTKLYKEQRNFTLQVMNENIDNPVGLLLGNFSYYSYDHQDELSDFLDNVDPKLKDHPYYKNLANKLEGWAMLDKGAIAPNFAMSDTSGNPIEMYSQRGKYLLIDFWASWCKPCRIENPELLKVYLDFKPLGFEILGVSLDEKRDAWINAINKDGIKWVHISDLKGWQSEIVNTYQLNDLPATVLLGPEGKIIGKNLKRDQLRGVLEEVITP